MKLIALSQGLFTQVDDDKYDFLNQWKWYASLSDGKYYAVRCVRKNNVRRTIRMHRLLIGETNPRVPIDHANGDSLNNQLKNIRVSTHSQNMVNRKVRKNAICKYKGLYKRKGVDKWVARINKNNKCISLGCFDTEIEAAKAYDKAAIEIHKEFACLNFPIEQELKVVVE